MEVFYFIPPNIQVFDWLAVQNRIASHDLLAGRNILWSELEVCIIYEQEPETAVCILFLAMLLFMEGMMLLFKMAGLVCSAFCYGGLQ